MTPHLRACQRPSLLEVRCDRRPGAEVQRQPRANGLRFLRSAATTLLGPMTRMGECQRPSLLEVRCDSIHTMSNGAPVSCQRPSLLEVRCDAGQRVTDIRFGVPTAFAS